MGFFDSLLGRSKPPAPKLDNLFGLPSAAITLEASVDFRCTGVGAVSFRAPEGKAMALVRDEIVALLSVDESAIEVSVDSFGYTWITITQPEPDISALVTDLHAVNVSLVDHGFGPTLLCTTVTFVDPRKRHLALVYLYKQGTFFPFVPEGTTPNEGRDNIMELQIRDLVDSDLRMEPDLQKWAALWGAPGLPKS